MFERFASSIPAGASDARFDFFKSSLWPRLRDSGGPGTLLFVPSYFDFVRYAATALYCSGPGTDTPLSLHMHINVVRWAAEDVVRTLSIGHWGGGSTPPYRPLVTASPALPPGFAPS